MLDRFVVGCCWCGAIGFGLMFVFLGLGLPPQIPVVMQGIGLIGVFVALVAIISPGVRDAFVNRTTGRSLPEITSNAARIGGITTAVLFVAGLAQGEFARTDGALVLVFPVIVFGITFAVVLVWQFVFSFPRRTAIKQSKVSARQMPALTDAFRQPPPPAPPVLAVPAITSLPKPENSTVDLSVVTLAHWSGRERELSPPAGGTGPTKQYMIVEQGRIFEHGRASQYWNGDLLVRENGGAWHRLTGAELVEMNDKMPEIMKAIHEIKARDL